MLQTSEKDTRLCFNSPVADVTDDAVGVVSRQWFVGIVPSNHEKKVADQLSLDGYDTYVASQPRLRVYSSGRKKWVTQVLIRSKIFIKCTDKERHSILKHPQLLRFMTDPSASPDSDHRALAVIPDPEIQTLKFMLGQSEFPVSFQESKFVSGIL